MRMELQTCFHEVGEPSTPLILKSGRNHFNYYMFEQQDGQQFLTSNFSQPTAIAGRGIAANER